MHDGLGDGAFAIAMTLLVLDLRAPAAEAIHSEWKLLHALRPLLPRLLVPTMTFLALAQFTTIGAAGLLAEHPGLGPRREVAAGEA